MYQKNALVNKNVLSFCLKSLLLQADLMLMGRLFQSCSAAAMKDQFPHGNFHEMLWVLRKIPLLLFHRKSWWDGCKTEIKWLRFLGAEPWSTLKVIKRILNSIHRWIGSQWSCWRSGITLKCMGAQKINCTQAFITHGSFCMWWSGMYACM